MHLTGDYISGGSEFSASKWLSTTEFYVEMIQNLNSENWTAIFQALQRLQESHKRDEQIEIGAPLTPVQREALLPADPPTPPALR